MSDAAYKTRTLQGLQPSSPASGGLAPHTRCKWSPLRALFEAQDHVVACSRRVVAEWSLSGADDWAQPDGSADPESALQVYTSNAWRELGEYRAHLTPGCMLVAHVSYCPAGLVQKFGGSTYHPDGAWGEARVGVTWSSVASSTGPHYFGITMPGSTLGTYGGAEASGDGDNWRLLDEKQIPDIRPPDYTSTASTQATYSEWADMTIVLQVRGGARVQGFVVYEVPIVHTTSESNAGLTSVHAMPPGQSPLTPRPMIKAPNGPTNDENRFGTRRMMQVAERCSERLGPRVLSWSSWNESTHSTILDTENDPVTVTSASFVDLLDSTITSYSASNPGFVVAGAHAQLQRLCGPYVSDGRFAVIPVRVRVEASQSSSTGTVRVQCGQGYVDVSITGARAWYTATGFLRSQVYPDDAAAPLVVLISSGSGARTLSVWNVSIDFGTWAS